MDSLNSEKAQFSQERQPQHLSLRNKLSPFPADEFGSEADITLRARLWLEQARAGSWSRT